MKTISLKKCCQAMLCSGILILPQVLPAQSVDGGKSHTVAVCSNGNVYAFGNNVSGQLGNGTNTSSNIPVQVSSLSGVVSVAAGEDHTLAVKSDGTLWAWGANSSGQLGDGTTVSKNTPVQVSGLTGIIAAAGGDDWSLALKNDGTVWAWGDNSGGQLGNGTSGTSTSAPAQIAGLTGIIAIRASEATSLALKNDGTVWAWGDNGNGEIGDGTTTDRQTPVQVSALTDIVQIATWEEHSLALKNDGTVWAWGANYYGGIGDGTMSNVKTTPVQVPGLSGITQIACGEDFSLALQSNGTFWAWGNNQFGQFGNGLNTMAVTSPVQVSGLTNINYMLTGEDHTIVVKSDGTIQTFGRNSDGQLGNGTNTHANTPQSVSVCAVPLGINEKNSDAELMLYPNPTTGNLLIRLNDSDALVSVSDILGNIVHEGRTNSKELSVDLSGKQAGIYLVRITSGTHQAVKKVSVVR